MFQGCYMHKTAWEQKIRACVVNNYGNLRDPWRILSYYGLIAMSQAMKICFTLLHIDDAPQYKAAIHELSFIDVHLSRFRLLIATNDADISLSVCFFACITGN